MVYGNAYKMLRCFLRMQKLREHDMSILLYPAPSRWGTYRACCSRRDGAGTAVKTDSWAGRTHWQETQRQVYWSLSGINSD